MRIVQNPAVLEGTRTLARTALDGKGGAGNRGARNAMRPCQRLP